MDDTDVKMPVIKCISVWITVFLSSFWQVFAATPWEILAQFLAFVYSMILVCEWIYKKCKGFMYGTD